MLAEQTLVERLQRDLADGDDAATSRALVRALAIASVKRLQRADDQANAGVVADTDTDTDTDADADADADATARWEWRIVLRAPRHAHTDNAGPTDQVIDTGTLT